MKFCIALLALALVLWAAADTYAAVPASQVHENTCTCYSVICWFMAEYQPDGQPSDHKPEPLLLWMAVPRRAVREFISGNWGCDGGVN